MASLQVVRADIRVRTQVNISCYYKGKLYKRNIMFPFAEHCDKPLSEKSCKAVASQDFSLRGLSP